MEILQKLGSLPIFILMFIIIYFVMIRPQSIQQKKHQSLLLNLKKGDKVLTRGGIVGKVVEISGKNKDRVKIDTYDGSKITVLKSYIVSLDT
ncbi:preprotein translocase subunit YajC [Candidatus Marinimicrobia bacterium]|nr:preprotein translocase subunit YajC [Candidatus Neomarinimicrobiota bacterium]